MALLTAILFSVVFFFSNPISACATEDSGGNTVLTDLSDPDFGEITEIVLPDSISDKDDVFTFGFGFHVNDAESFPDGKFTYTLPADLDFSDIANTQIKVSRGDTEIGYAEISSDNVITFYLDPENFKDNPNGIDGNIAISCKLGENSFNEDDEAEIRFSEELVYKVVIDNPDAPDAPDDPDPENPDDPNPDNPGEGDAPSFTASLAKESVKNSEGVERDPATGVVNWTSTLHVEGEGEGFSFDVTDTIKPANAGNNATSWLNGKKVGANIVADSVKVYKAEDFGNADAAPIENASVSYNGNSFTISFDNISSGEYVIAYSTYDYYGNTRNHTFPGGHTVKFNNGISVGTPGVDASATASYEVASEGLPMRKTDLPGRFDPELGTYVIPWEIKINQNIYKQSISTLEEGSLAKITDNLPANLYYKEGSAVITDSRGGKIAQEPVLSKDGEKDVLSWEFTWGKSNTYKISYETIVDKTYYESFVNSSENGTLQFIFVNKVEGSVGDAEGSASATADEKIRIVDKSAIFDEKTQLLNYTIVVNAKGLLLNNGKDITLSDEIKNGTFVSGSLKVYEYGTNAEVAIDESKVLFSNQGTRLDVSLPDGKPLTVKYSVRPDTKAGTDAGNGKVIVEVTNNASLLGASKKTSSVSDSYKMNKVSASVSSKSGSITITKEDKNKPEEKLAGAEIGLYKVDLTSGASSLVATKTTADPLGFVKFSEDGSYSSLIFDTLYYYQELSAPDGYKLDAAKHYFIFASNKYKKVKDKIASVVGDAELTVINVKTDGSAYETVLYNEVKGTDPEPTKPSEEKEEPKKDEPSSENPSSSGDNGNGGNSDNGGSGGSNESSNGGSSSDGGQNVTTNQAVAAAIPDLPQVLGARVRDLSEYPDLPEVLSARRSATGDTDTLKGAIVVLLAASAVLILLIIREIKSIKK